MNLEDARTEGPFGRRPPGPSQSSGPAAIAIAAGGTGGHIMPAISVGRAVGAIAPQCRVEYVCGRREQEAEWFRAAGIVPVRLPIGRMGSGFWRKSGAAAALVFSAAKMMIFLRRARVGVVLGMGGYLSAPPCVAALALRRPVVIHEANAVLGRTNRWLARRARFIASAYKEIENLVPAGRFRWTGNPVRETMGTASREDGCREFGLAPARPVVAVTGGSQGAVSLNRFVGEALRRLDAAQPGAGIQVVWACGHNDYEECVKRYPADSFRGIDVRMVPFIAKMESFWAAASLAITRAGASTLSEMALCGVPAIVFPLRSAMDDHQRLNAEALVGAGAATAMSEFDSRPEQLAGAIADLLANEEKLKAMSAAARTLARPNAARDIACLALEAAQCGS